MSELEIGVLASVCEACLESGDVSILRAMGLKPSATIKLCRQGEPCVVEILPAGPCEHGCVTRLGLARDLARRVMVVPV